MGKVFCFGEILLRFSPVLNRQWLHEKKIAAFVGGAELNVASALAKWGLPVSYCSALPDNYLSQEIIIDLDEKNIDTSAFHFGGNRIGIYFLPRGADLKNAGVIYDRAGSSFVNLKPGMINWKDAFKDVSWFHFSAITPALSQASADLCEEALQAAVSKGITISIDLNYRSKLWQYGKKPVEIMPELVKYCNVIMGNVWSANSLLGIPVDTNIHNNASKDAYLSHSLKSADTIQKTFTACTTVANTFRFDHGQNGIRYFSALYKDGEQVASPEFFAETILDKVGSGDCFMAGLIHGLHKNNTPQQIIDFAASAAYGKFFEEGDVTNQAIPAIEERLKKI